jgi:hypothetical protein
LILIGGVGYASPSISAKQNPNNEGLGWRTPSQPKLFSLKLVAYAGVAMIFYMM